MMIKEAIIFVGGAIVGSVATYFVVDKKLDEKYNKLAESEINEIKKRYEDKLDELNRTEIKGFVNPSDEVLEKLEESNEVDISLDDEYDFDETVDNTPIVNYNTISSVKEEKVNTMRKEKFPYLLNEVETEDALEANRIDPEVDRIVCVSYYMRDNICVADGMELDDDDIRESIGFDNLDILKDGSEEIIYTKSEYGTVYEVERFDDYWR